MTALTGQYTAERTNLLVISLLGLALLLIPLLLLLRRWIAKQSSNSASYALTSAVPVVLVAVLVNFDYWPSFLPERQFLGFPHGLEIIIGPFVFAPVGVLLGFLLARLWNRRVRGRSRCLC